jgi:hypothetical protein
MSKKHAPITSSTPCICHAVPRDRSDIGPDIVECSTCTHRWYAGEPVEAPKNPNFTASEDVGLFDASPYVDYGPLKRRRRR